MSTVSVVVPCYNAQAYISEALESVRAQTCLPLETIVIDDRSTDASLEIVRGFSGIRLLENPFNMGNGLVRNRALFEARGDLIAFLDADDIWLPHHLETVVGLLERHPAAVVGFSAVEFIGSRQGAWRTSLPEDQPVDAFWECLQHTCVPQMTAVVRSSVLASVGGYQQPSPSYRSAPDYDLWLRISRHFPLVATREVTARYRWHPKQISQTARQEQVAAVYHSRWHLLHEMQMEPVDERHGRVAAEIHRYWIRDYMQAFHARDFRQMRLLRAIRRRLRPSMPRSPKLPVRSLLPLQLIQWLDTIRGRPAAERGR